MGSPVTVAFHQRYGSIRAAAVALASADVGVMIANAQAHTAAATLPEHRRVRHCIIPKLISSL